MTRNTNVGAVPAMSGADPTDEAPPPLRDLLGFQLRRAHMLFAQHWQLSFRNEPERITPVQGGMLLVIDSHPGLTQAALARLMDVEAPTLLQSVDRLEANGLVQRIRRAGDRRAYALQLTQAGERAVAAVRNFVPHREAELLTDLTTAERVLFLDLLKRVVHRGHVVIAELATRPDPAAQPLSRHG